MSPHSFNASPLPERRKCVGVGVSRWTIGVILILSIFINLAKISETASLVNSNTRRRVRGTGNPTTTTTTSTTFDFSDENKRLLRLESANPHSYLYRYRAPRTTTTTATATSPMPISTVEPQVSQHQQQQPRVLLRLNAQSGLLSQRRIFNGQEDKMPKFTTPLPSTLTPKTESSTKAPLFEEDEEFSDIDDGEYPYQYYLDFEENQQKSAAAVPSKTGKGPPDPKAVEYLTPEPSENLKPLSLAQHQSSIWNEFVNSEVFNTATTPPPSYLNEINDNYTIPSLKDYKFPDFKAITTAKPPKPDYLNPYEFFSEEDFENVADLDLTGDHNKYFVKTKPRDVSHSISNLYNSFYYEPPSYSTKSQPFPVKAKQFSQELGKNEDDAKTKLKFNKWNNNEIFNLNNFVTFPMTQTPATTASQESWTTTSTYPSHLSAINSEPTISTFLPTFTTTVPPPLMDPKNFSKYPTSYDFNSHSKPSDVATAESINLSSKSESATNLNVIPAGLGIFDISPKIYNNPYLLPTTPDATSIPGMPGIDYPIFDEIPITSFKCQDQRYKGFFADIETNCQAWHYCDFTDNQSSFLCPNGTLFSQVLLTCDWWFNVECKQAQQLYVLNERLYRHIKPPKPSFPEDYHGPQVDLWLKKQLELGLLPKIKKRGGKPVPTTLKEKVVTLPVPQMNDATTLSSLPDEANDKN